MCQPKACSPPSLNIALMQASHVLAGLRIYLGVIFALAVYPKLAVWSTFADRLTGFLTNVALPNAQAPYRGFVTSVVLPHVGAFAHLVIVGETCVAIALITGTATRLAAVVAIFLLTNYMLAKGLWWWNPSSNDAAFSAIALVLALTGAGRTFGVDALLAKRWPKTLIW